MPDLLDYLNEAELLEFPAGDFVLKDGDHSDRLLVLVDGTVDVEKNEMCITRIKQPGALFGEISFLLKIPHTADVKTVKPSRFRVVENPERFLSEHPNFALEVGRILASRVQSMTEYLGDIKKQFADQSDHLSMLDDVLGSLAHRPLADRSQRRGFEEQ